MDYYKLPHGLTLESVEINRRGKAPEGHHRFVSKDGFPVGYTLAELSPGGMWAKWFGGWATSVAAEPGEVLSHPRGGKIISGVDRPCPSGCGEQVVDLGHQVWVCYGCWEAGMLIQRDGVVTAERRHGEVAA